MGHTLDALFWDRRVLIFCCYWEGFARLTMLGADKFVNK